MAIMWWIMGCTGDLFKQMMLLAIEEVVGGIEHIQIAVYLQQLISNSVKHQQ